MCPLNQEQREKSFITLTSGGPKHDQTVQLGTADQKNRRY
jgi:hypothetical protein